VLKTTPRPFYPRERDPVPIIQEERSAPEPVWTGKLVPPGFDPYTVLMSLYLLSYRDPPSFKYPNIILYAFLSLWWLHSPLISCALIMSGAINPRVTHRLHITQFSRNLSHVLPLRLDTRTRALRSETFHCYFLHC
jgi:hypothetical protein